MFKDLSKEERLVLVLLDEQKVDLQVIKRVLGVDPHKMSKTVDKVKRLLKDKKDLKVDYDIFETVTQEKKVVETKPKEKVVGKGLLVQQKIA